MGECDRCDAIGGRCSSCRREDILRRRTQDDLERLAALERPRVDWLGVAVLWVMALSATAVAIFLVWATPHVWDLLVAIWHVLASGRPEDPLAAPTTGA